ncbi:MAG: hypothetical protein AM324_006175 [Candidatus Thorarchaeota archaeon SMTZ1-83]|nr:MAG: hypothetical protein AM324_07310 [Candidatus Thorarchaeota archaeon SMTZ1-83]
MPTEETSSKEFPLFPILRGESVGEDGDFSGHVFILCNPEDFDREWASDDIAVLGGDLNEYVTENPEVLNSLFKSVSAVLSEFGGPLSQFSSAAIEQESICVVKIADASHVLENDMHIRVAAKENQGDIFFID